jgi:hypothetical protein
MRPISPRAIWLADSADRSLGHLDLVTIDRQTGAADPAGPSLAAARPCPVSPSAVATSPGRLRPARTDRAARSRSAWSGPHAGQISSQAASGSDPVIVVQH